MSALWSPVWLAVPLALALVALPGTALACPSCLAAQDSDVQMAFILATGFMTALPLALIGGLVLWLRRRLRRLDAEEAAGVIRLPSAPPRTNRAA
jgi:hypothetical protein